MSIERMKTVWLFDPHERDRELMNRVAAMGLSHIVSSGYSEQEHAGLGIREVFPELADIELRVQQLADIHEIFLRFSSTTRDFLSNFISTPMEVRQSEVRETVATLDIPRLHEEVRALHSLHSAQTAAREKAYEAYKVVRQFEKEQFLIPGEKELRRVAGWAGVMPSNEFERMRSSGRIEESFAIAVVARTGRTVVIQAAVPKDDEQALRSLLGEYSFEPFESAETISMKEYVLHRKQAAEEADRQLQATTSQLETTAAETRRKVEVALGYWEERKSIADAASLLAKSKRLTILKGYVREEDLAEFQRRVEKELPDVAVIAKDPARDEQVPVSLKNPKLFSPASVLVSMFGMPNYFTFDPTPVIFFSFLIFFGFCFGDGIYGIGLILMGVALARKYREYPGIRSFFTLLAYGGVTTLIMGALTGTWAADLFSYFGEQSAVNRAVRSMTVLDMLKSPLLALGIALGIGVANQFVGMFMLMVRNLRQGDFAAAIFDSCFWLIALPALVIVVAGVFVPVPGPLTKLAIWMFIGGTIGLVLTQGRAEKSFLGKAVVGVVSLYGIVGTYGITGFIGDTLSYSRLLALGLTTGIVGMCFNIIAKLAAQLGGPALGIAIFVLVVILGHTFNFFISILGGFVHSARLTFVEFFGRFYQGGSPRFSPLGTWQGRIRVTDSNTVWND